MAPASRHAAQIHRHSRFVHRSAGPPGTINATPRATAAIACATIQRSLLGLRPKSAVDARPQPATPHLAHRSIESHARVWLQRTEPFAIERPRACFRASLARIDQAEDDQAKTKCEQKR
jgi:hypothetical protein